MTRIFLAGPAVPETDEPDETGRVHTALRRAVANATGLDEARLMFVRGMTDGGPGERVGFEISGVFEKDRWLFVTESSAGYGVAENVPL